MNQTLDDGSTTHLTALESAVLNATLSGEDADTGKLRSQLATLRVTGRDRSDAGIFIDFDVDPALSLGPRRLVLIGPDVDIPGLPDGAIFTLFVEDGLLSTLQGITLGEDPWPAAIEAFTLRPFCPEPPTEG